MKGIVYQHLGEFDFFLKANLCVIAPWGRAVVVMQRCSGVWSYRNFVSRLISVGLEEKLITGALMTWKPANVQKSWQISPDMVVKHHWDTCSRLSALACLLSPLLGAVLVAYHYDMHNFQNYAPSFHLEPRNIQ